MIIMFQTVIGIFNHNADAQNAVERLVNSGFDRGLIDVSLNKCDESSDGLPGVAIGDEMESDRIETFFKAAFPEESDTYRYLAVGRNRPANL
jgi:hypothetical protein